MKIELIFLSRVKNKHVSALIDGYIRRIGSFVSIRKSIIVSEDSLRRLPSCKSSGTFLIAVDEGGQQFTSCEFARYIGELITTKKSFAFVFGSAEGIPQELLSVAEDRLCLSRMTLQNEIARLVFVEQLYRALTIIKGRKYHK